MTSHHCRELQYVYIETQHGILIVIFSKLLVYAQLCTVCMFVYVSRHVLWVNEYLHLTAGCEVWLY